MPRLEIRRPAVIVDPGYGSTITYCRAEGSTTIVLRAVDTSGNVSAPSNEIIFNC
jgi:hypothetical protein